VNNRNNRNNRERERERERAREREWVREREREREREKLSFNPLFPFGAGRIASNMTVYHSIIFCSYTSLERCNTLISDALLTKPQSFGESRTGDVSLKVRHANLINKNLFLIVVTNIFKPYRCELCAVFLLWPQFSFVQCFIIRS